MFSVRKATLADMPVMKQIYVRARQFMKEQGNESQWGLPSPGKQLWPSDESLVSNIEDGTQYILEADEGSGILIAAAFRYTQGHDPLYDTIYNGAWPDDDEYGVLHMLAASGKVKGTGKAVFDWALEQCPTLRIDTHPNNKPMRTLLEKSGFAYCGRVDMYSVQNDDVTRVCYIRKRSIEQREL